MGASWGASPSTTDTDIVAVPRISAHERRRPERVECACILFSRLLTEIHLRSALYLP